MVWQQVANLRLERVSWVRVPPSPQVMSQNSYRLQHKKLGLCRNCPKPVVEGSATFCAFHKEKARVHRVVCEKKFALKIKEECFQHYGGACLCCGENIIQFLTIEHENGGGNRHRKKLFGHNVGGVHMYRWLKRNNFPSGYSILCMNCNWAKRLSGVCPHKISVTKNE